MPAAASGTELKTRIRNIKYKKYKIKKIYVADSSKTRRRMITR
jgi:hypothetical protein